MNLFNIEYQILTKIKKARRGTLYFVENFIGFGNANAIRKALERLVKSGELFRFATGMYTRPQIDPVIGVVMPTIDDIAIAIARKDKARIMPTGVYALNKLGFSEQVPLNIVYLTDGSARKIKVANRTITFKKTSPKNVSAVGEISKLVIQALRVIGKDKITKLEIEKIQHLLMKEKKTRLEYDIRLAPNWIREIMYPALKSMS